MRFGPVSMWEILIILVIVLLIFGPRRLPEMAKGIGQSVREFRKGIRDMKEDFVGDDDSRSSRSSSSAASSSSSSRSDDSLEAERARLAEEREALRREREAFLAERDGKPSEREQAGI